MLFFLSGVLIFGIQYNAAQLQLGLCIKCNMGGSTWLEVFGDIVFRFTRSVTEHYNPEEPEFTAESFGYDPLQSTGREWYYLPVDELIYQEYSDKDIRSFAYLASSSLDVQVIDACSPEDSEDEGDQENREQEKDKEMAWKRLRPSVLQTVVKAMYIGGLISLLAASIVGTIYTLLSYLNYKTAWNCEFHPGELTAQMQWMRTIAAIVGCVVYYAYPVLNLLFLFRPHQLNGIKTKLILVPFVMYILDALFRTVLQAFEKPFFNLPALYRGLSNVPVFIFVFTSICVQFYFVARHLLVRLKPNLTCLICKMAISPCCAVITAFIIRYAIYTAYNKQDTEGKLVIAIFSPLMGVVVKAISRICVQRLWNITHPGYSYVLLAPLYCLLSVMFRGLQAELESLQSIAVLGIIHGFAEVVERSTVAVIDHLCHQLCRRESLPWGSFRTPRRERLTADIIIMSMLFESTAIVSVNGLLYLYQLIYLVGNDSFLELSQSFAIHTSVPLVIEWFFNSVSIAIETRYQNMAVMAVWRKQWKRHILVAIVNVLPAALWTSGNLLVILHERFDGPLTQSCKMPFT